MSPLEAYLARVRSRLPCKGRDDIVQELRGALLDRIERREAEWGRPLSDAEQETIVRGFGRPQAIAGRYWTGTGLFGGPLTLYYRMTLLWSAVAVVVVHAALFAWRALRSHDVTAALTATRPGLIWALITAVAITTLVFAALDAARQRYAPPRTPSRV
ncbi:MAG TPA: hypothetical protein VGG10_00100 [Rhizomicrobium sp.]|jgi:hypothetical protein